MNKKWKRLFFLLLGLNIGFVILVLILIGSPTEEVKTPSQEERKTEDVVQFAIKSNKNDLNKVINHYIEENSKDSGIAYKVILEDEVELLGTMKVFTQDVELKLTFEPEPLENGDLLLKQKSISIGRLSLPVDYVLKFVRDRYSLPEWVTIQPKEKSVYVALQDMKLKSDIQVKVNTFDLKEDNIMFTLLVPTK